MVNVNFKNCNYDAFIGETVEEFIERKKIKVDNAIIVSANINNVPRGLRYRFEKDCDLTLVDTSSLMGQKIYKTSLSFVFIKAVKDVLQRKVKLCHTVSRGQFCEIEGMNEVPHKILKEIEAKMHEIIRKNMRFSKKVIIKEDAIDIFDSMDKYDHVNLLKTMYKENANVYSLGDCVTFFHNEVVPSTKYISKFKIIKENGGVVLLCPTKKDCNIIEEHKEQMKLLSAFLEMKSWGEITKIAFVGDLNKQILENKYKHIINKVEALHERKISDIAAEITKNKKRIVLIAGPTASGKTTFANRLKTQLEVYEYKSIAISLDDYFFNRNDTPNDEEGNRNFESIYALDLKLFNEHLIALLKGEEVIIPKFNFLTGKREIDPNRKIKITNNEIIIIEGIHGLNPMLTKAIKNEMKFKIYVAPVTQLNLDSHNRISSTDIRLIRRIVRDNKFRGQTPQKTLEMWHGIRKSEEKYIIPYQEEADAIFNSTLIYEIPILKKYLQPLLINISNDSMHYGHAKHLLGILDYFVSLVDETDMPPNSIIREFI